MSELAFLSWTISCDFSVQLQAWFSTGLVLYHGQSVVSFDERL